ncbi:hypothetical protein [Mycobacterium sp.]|uniref:hypothetical protein n=1 Tax=Mycobacterium sp. TaxID=1785 RepID=UPI002D9B2A4E|nr:hypothetical protein [Mycobacterium sp.]
MEEPSTCGEGFAGRFALPEKLGEMLGTHMRALDPTDADTRKGSLTKSPLAGSAAPVTPRSAAGSLRRKDHSHGAEVGETNFERPESP